ncbi:MAG TPA: hypothetical protein VH500_18235 [Nitrososphaeraceae archaeon]|jgi:hypothetical protein
MESRFQNRDYYYAIDPIKTEEIFPSEIINFIVDFTNKIRKLLKQSKKIRDKYNNIIYNELSDIWGIQPVDEERNQVIGELTEIAEKVIKYKKMISELKKVIDKFGLPELAKVGVEDARKEADKNYYLG